MAASMNAAFQEVTLVYRGTFIDEDHHVETGAARRATSEPPHGVAGLEVAQEVINREQSLRSYVRSLAEVSALAFGASPTAKEKTQEFCIIEAQDHDTALPALADKKKPWSCGSRGHPQLCRRPCIYFASGRCTTGAQCNYCHLAHEERGAKLDKQQRQKLASMGCGEALRVLRDMLKQNAAENGFLDLAKDVLGLMEKEMVVYGPLEDISQESAHRRLERVLARMPFHQLALLAVSKTQKPEFSCEMNHHLEQLTSALDSAAESGQTGDSSANGF